MEIIFALTVLTVSGPVTVEPYRMGQFESAADCQSFGEAFTPNIERLTRILSSNGVGFDGLQPFTLQQAGPEIIVSFRCDG